MATHPFKVGGYYANRKGRYEVLSIDDGSGNMVVSYTKNSDEDELTIQTQARIWQNMAWEEQEQEQRAAAKEASYQKGYGEGFTGLQEGDFKRSTQGTTWRSRRGLAGLVSLLLSDGTPYTFISWSIYRWPVAFLTHREDYSMAAFEMGSRKAKYTLETDEKDIYYGFYIEKYDEPMDATWDWTRLMAAFKRDPSLLVVIQEAERQHGVRFLGRHSYRTEHFHFTNGIEKGSKPLWDEARSTKIPLSERLTLLENIPPNYWGELYILGATPKYEAVQAGLSLADSIAAAMRALLPVYRAAVTIS